MTKPDVSAVMAYLGLDPNDEAEQATVSSALAAEASAQAKRCRVPVPTDDVPDPEWDADLAEALCRRVGVNLAVRNLPLGIQASLSEVGVATNRVGGGDAEVQRLEAPFRRRVVG